MIQAHADVMLGLLRADVDLTVYDGAAPNAPPDHYLLVYFVDNDPELSGSTPLTGEASRFVMRAYLHCVGGNAIAARAVAQRARVLLLGVTPTVAGRTCFPIRREEGQPPQRDESTGALVMDKVDLYRLESIPG